MEELNIIDEEDIYYSLTLMRIENTPANKKESARVNDVLYRDSRKSAITNLSSANRYHRSGIAGSDFPASGQVTAGEWNDLINWKDWLALLKKEEYLEMEDHWNISTQRRYHTLVLNEKNIPLSNAVVDLIDEHGSVLWTGRTDLSGRAELFAYPFEVEKSKAAKIEVSFKGKSQTIANIKSISEGSNLIKIPNSCTEKTGLDIAFLVDATSSMQDEISYLQSELLNVIQRVNESYKDIRWASMFYRDHNEEYLTKHQDFHSDPDVLMKFIQKQNAAGGGDYPEEVSEALRKSIRDLSWNNKSVVKILFLLLDAPPHDHTASLEKYRKTIQEAAQKGIKIIPITASGINRYAEFLMKFTSILTNGTYVFITDDSGIGNSHLDPVVENYKVEKLNELLIRLIEGYSQEVDCEVYIEKIWTGKVFPNPATEWIHVNELKKGDIIQLISPSGKILTTASARDTHRLTLKISDFIPGSYFLRITRADNVISKPILIIR